MGLETQNVAQTRAKKVIKHGEEITCSECKAVQGVAVGDLYPGRVLTVDCIHPVRQLEPNWQNGMNIPSCWNCKGKFISASHIDHVIQLHTADGWKP
jgi:hypothetical protein